MRPACAWFNNAVLTNQVFQSPIQMSPLTSQILKVQSFSTKYVADLLQPIHQCVSGQKSATKFCTIQYSIVPYSIVSCHTVQYCAIQYSIVPYSIVLCHTVQYCAIQYSIVPYNIVLCHTVQYCAIQYSIYSYCTGRVVCAISTQLVHVCVTTVPSDIIFTVPSVTVCLLMLCGVIRQSWQHYKCRCTEIIVILQNAYYRNEVRALLTSISLFTSYCTHVICKQ